MKKNYLLLFVSLFVWQINAQVLNQNAAWPNGAWSVTGTYNTNPLAFEGNPTTSANFAFDDDDAGQTSIDNIAAESPVIDLTAAVAAGETKVRVSGMYTYRILAGYLRLEYWDADAAAWTAWGPNFAGNNTLVNDNFCTPAKTAYASTDLDVSAFTATQKSGFRYRIAFDDLDWEWGFCFDSPTIISVPVPCLAGYNFPAGTINPGTCDGFTPTLISNFSWAGDYFNVNVTAGQTYKFTSSVATDFFTISTDGDLTAAASGTQPLSWVSTVTGSVRVHINTNITCGTEDVDRSTNVICGTLCINGGLYPNATLTPTTCDGSTLNVLTTDSWAGEYSNIEVFSANTYTFSSSVATDYITITSADGLTALAVGTGSITGFTPAANGIVRFYFHTDSSCGTENVNRERQVVCTTAAVVPGCPTNPNPADGSLTVPAFSDVILSWDAPTTGDPAISYDVYGGVTSGNLTFFGNVTTTSFNAGTIGAYEFVGYWQVIAINAAGESVGCAEWMFTTEPQPTDEPDYVGLQWPPTLNFPQGGSGTVYGQVWEPGLTDTTTGQAPGILAWVGISDEGDNSSPDNWTTWVPATFNVETNGGNNDEYQATIGATLAPGTYYYATRFTLNGGPYVYGGINGSNQGGEWDGTSYLSGVLTVTPPPAPVNDECIAATPLVVDDSVCNGTNTNGTNIGATDSGVAPATCFNYGLNDVWYSFVAPSDTATVDVSTDFLGGTLQDTEVALYSGVCGSLVQVACDNDGGTVVQPNGFSWNSLIINATVTAGQTYYVRVAGYTADWVGTFCLRVARNQLLSNEGFDNANFSYYPNPVKNVLNLSYNQVITNVEVFNLLGQKMTVNAIGGNQGQVDMSNLASGTYMVRVTADDQVKTIKVVKE
ncbi:T9SS type A sorting domain-containing protein [Flavobacterium terrisoli]|uniref:T9SS type A sorting domain-containing protein n=1 Tax=Flavobacterium terrisoli TaxID=3242195 RepID=UPI0025434B80|nr:T9SS type A sorting domain-containing protein [Flavobacterium buctense]